MFGGTYIVKYNDKEKYGYSGYGVAFDGKGSWSFNDDFARNGIIFRIDNSSVHHLILIILKNEFLILGEVLGKFLILLSVLMEALVHQKKIILILGKQRRNCVWACIILNIKT